MLPFSVWLCWNWVKRNIFQIFSRSPNIFDLWTAGGKCQLGLCLFLQTKVKQSVWTSSRYIGDKHSWSWFSGSADVFVCHTGKRISSGRTPAGPRRSLMNILSLLLFAISHKNSKCACCPQQGRRHFVPCGSADVPADGICALEYLKQHLIWGEGVMLWLHRKLVSRRHWVTDMIFFFFSPKINL